MYAYWGKTKKDNDPEELQDYHLVVYHNLDVAAAAYAILTENPLLLQRLAGSCGMDTGHFLAWYVFLMSQHDCGKFSERFQGQHDELFAKFHAGKERPPYTLRHDSMGYVLWFDVLLKELQQGEASPIKTVLEHSLECLESVDDDILDFWSTPVMGHHGKPPTTTSRSNEQYNSPGSAKKLFSEQAIEDARTFCRECVSLFSSELAPTTEFTCNDILPIFLNWDMAGLATLADWIGSDCRSFAYHTEPMPLAEYWHKHAVPQAREAIRHKGLLPVQLAERLSFAEFFPSIATPTPLQQWAATMDFDGTPSLFIVEDVTGSGKTEAALLLANRIMAAGAANGLFIALPTMATSNQMFTRLAKAYRRLFDPNAHPSLVLAHGASDVHEQFQQSILSPNERGDGTYGTVRASTTDTGDADESISSECNAWFADARRKAFLATVGVGTIDQVFLGVLHSKFQALRLFGLGTKVLVVDEVHANDTYMHHMLCEVLAFHAARGGSAILLSATLPASMRHELVEGFYKGLRATHGNALPQPAIGNNDVYPLITTYSATGIREQGVDTRPDVARTVAVECVHTVDDIPKLIADYAKEGRVVCWIRNTVADAIDAYSAIAAYIPPAKLHLFHARFALCDRKRIEDEVIAMFGKTSTSEQRKGRVLIATQVVEQSLDLDFDVLITDLAPIDLVVQRAGRLRRHRRTSDGALIEDATTPDGRPQPPTLLVVTPDPDGEKDDNGENIGITKDWFAAFFVRAKSVYPNHAVLWRTARILKDTGSIVMPDGARNLIESVYGEAEALPLPHALLDVDYEHEGTIKAEKSIARANVLKLDRGYTKTLDNWVDDLITPTRLGEATVTLRLSVLDNGRIHPLAGTTKHAWFQSSVSIRAALVDEEVAFPDNLAEAVQQAKQRMPDKGKYSILVLLEKKDNILQGEAQCNGKYNVKRKTITYSSKIGLSITTQEDNP